MPSVRISVAMINSEEVSPDSGSLPSHTSLRASKKDSIYNEETLGIEENLVVNNSRLTRDEGIEHEESVLPINSIKSEQESDSKSNPSVPLYQLFSFADGVDYVLMILGTIGACVHGASIPVFFIFFGKLINAFGSHASEPHVMAKEVAKAWSFSPVFYFFATSFLALQA